MSACNSKGNDMKFSGVDMKLPYDTNFRSYGLCARWPLLEAQYFPTSLCPEGAHAWTYHCGTTCVPNSYSVLAINENSQGKDICVHCGPQFSLFFGAKWNYHSKILALREVGIRPKPRNYGIPCPTEILCTYPRTSH